MNKIYIKGDTIFIHDPTVEFLPFISTLDPTFTVSSFRPPEGFIPQFQLCRRTLVKGFSRESVHDKSIAELKRLHSNIKVGGDSACALLDSSITLLDLKKEISFRHIRRCEICAWRCKVNRYSEKGKCGLDYRAFHAEPFLHIGEEGVINPAIVVNFKGCSLDCVYCIGHGLKDSKKLIPLNVNTFWSKIISLLKSDCPINTLEFAGGNPTESLHWILEILSVAPDDFQLPIVWNCNLYVADYAIALLDGVVDIYLVDFRYGNDECARRLSKAENSWEQSTRTIEEMIKQNTRIIVRILVLPNHRDCCHTKVLEWLSQYRDHIWVSVLDQYIPEHIANEFKDINRRPTTHEIEEVEELVQKNGLRNIKDCAEAFWNSG